MKIISTLLLLICSYCLQAQAVFADPSLGQVFITNSANTDPGMPPTLPRDMVHQLRLPIYNLHATNAIPAGTTKIKIGLGSRMVLDPAFNLLTTNTSAYFNWTVENVGGQVQLTGDQVAPLPQNFSDTGVFAVKGIILGTSTITTNFLVTNHAGGAVTVSDENGANNVSSQLYFIAEALPVTFTGLQVKNDNCAVLVSFSSGNEINLSKYVIEYAADGVNFLPAGQLLPHISRHYSYRFAVPATITGIIYVRVKALDVDGSYQYTDIKALRDLCNGRADALLYPNPVPTHLQQVTIARNDGVFNGRYSITLFDAAGRTVQSNYLQLVYTRVFDYGISHLTAGQYTIQIREAAAVTAPVVLSFQKL